MGMLCVAQAPQQYTTGGAYPALHICFRCSALMKGFPAALISWSASLPICKRSPSVHSFLS